MLLCFSHSSLYYADYQTRTIRSCRSETRDLHFDSSPLSSAVTLHKTHFQTQSQTRLLQYGQSIILSNSSGQPLNAGNVRHQGSGPCATSTVTSGTTTTYYKTADQQSLILQPNITVKLEPPDQDYYENSGNLELIIYAPLHGIV